MSTPSWSAVAIDPEGQRLLLGRRVAFFGRVVFLLSAAFYVRTSVEVYGASAIAGTRAFAHLLHLAAVCTSLAQWLSCRGNRLSLRAIYWVDAAGTIGAMAFYAASFFVSPTRADPTEAAVTAFVESLNITLIMMAVVLTRAIIVPSTARRTLIVSAVACAIAPLASFAAQSVHLPAAMLARNPWQPLDLASYVLMWAVLTVVVSTIAARVIHGLSQRVRDADQIGQYRLERKIGEGGMGVVYLARHALLRRPTAVKLLLAERAGESAVRRFEHEVQLTSALTHPNTISIFDFGRTPDGIFYYAMEYLDGITLEDLVVHDGPQPEARVARILAQVCGALSEAHGLGLIHRDIKPANLMLCRQGGVADQVKVLDFGLVKDHSGEALTLSQTGAILGTPQYLAPESILDPSAADARLDLYAVGAVGYFLLTGKPVFEGRSIVEVCAKHLHDEPQPPSKHRDAPLQPAFEALILRCLAKAPAGRPASAKELAGELTAFTRQPGFDDADAERWWRERAKAIIAEVDTRRHVSASLPGPKTVAIDFDARAKHVAPAMGPTVRLPARATET